MDIALKFREVDDGDSRFCLEFDVSYLDNDEKNAILKTIEDARRSKQVLMNMGAFFLGFIIKNDKDINASNVDRKKQTIHLEVRTDEIYLRAREKTNETDK